ncbi:hypothetical protein [Dietzia psychralcaliphila]|uniref:hypothetical protein n=1 Tax=Dietzia psychralcaliphila TaxID=139021 RepID=UPI0011B29068|nr:hypothetical protein [Dietzia psychralcaliphila]
MGPGSVAGAGVGPVAAALVAFERVAVVAEATRVREAGVRAAEQAGSLAAVLGETSSLAAALGEASAAAGGAGAAPPGGVLSGAALEECAALLARRAQDSAVETEQIAERMESAAQLLLETDEEVARRVAGAAG